ncbi:sorting nexin lst-4-like isoform X1 [Haliotis cracherodii]|uniref:sorting nexin lst-4-like isoform X1 n=1 Tax=Haliotis cracherodii TaxID=6455 RepID=UPI0039EAF3AB
MAEIQDEDDLPVMFEATALYDFDGDTQNGELNLAAGETIYVLRQDIGEGWWEAKNSRGDQGLVPESYLEVVSIPEPEFPPPPVPFPATIPSTIPTAVPATRPADLTPAANGWGGAYNQNGQHGAMQQQQQQSYDEWDEDWDDDEDDQSSNSTTGGANQDLQGSGSFGLSVPKREHKAHSPTSEMSKYGTIKSSFNRWSHFAKSGGEAFMMGQNTGNTRVAESDLIRMIETIDGPEWTPIQSQYTCEVASPKKESKMKGLKSFIAYQITPSFNGIQVSRRYKHFDWLHERLEEKFPCIPIPPLPDKAISGRYEDDFVNERMRQLQMWVDRMARHPIVSQSDVFSHFLTCTDEKRWKAGKRKAEKDEFLGGKFFLLLQTPPHPLDLREVELKMENFCKFVMSMTESTKSFMNVLHEHTKKQSGGFKGQYHKIGTGFKQLAASFNLDRGEYSQSLTAAMDYTGDTYKEIGDLYGEQPSNDTWPLFESVGEYKGILHVYPDVVKVHEGAIGKAKECQKLQDEGKMTDKEVQEVMQKSDIISYGTLAEMNHFQKERVNDYKKMTKSFLQEQIKFFKTITQKLESTLAKFDEA